jgi:acetylornithine deacetylase/succinyl-diaminopimelate desuccinylase-like protein
MNKTLTVAGTIALLVSASLSLPSQTLAATASKAATSSAATEADFRDLYKELVETNTTASSGSCTLAAQRMADRLKAAGYPDEDFHLFSVPEHPKDGGLVFVAPGSDPKLKPILLLAHLDVVEAKREDWTRDPFKLVEENGYFYARGAIDDKAEAAIWVDTLIRYRKENFHPRRTLKIALTCGEEGGGQFNGAEWLSQNQRELIDAEFALNEGAFGELDTQGQRVALEIQAGEKLSQNFQLEVTNPGGHSSRPLKNNAIYHLAGALKKIEPYEFPAQFTDGNRAYFTGMAKVESAKGETEIANAMNALVKDPNDAAAIALVSSKDPTWNATLRTTCVATMLNAGHAPNALPQRADANINCRIFPDVPAETVRQKLEELINDPEVKVTTLGHQEHTSPPPPLTPAVMGPFNKLAAQFWPGLPVVPILQPGATDGRYLNAAGIPTYGIEPLFAGPDLGHIHGLNEYIGVKSLLDARDFLYQLVKVYANQK